MSVRIRLIIIFVINLALLLGFGIFTILGQGRVNEGIQEISHRQIQAIDIAGTLGTSFVNYRLAQTDYAAAKSSVTIAASEDRILRIELNVDQLFADYDALDPQGRSKEMLTEVRERWRGYLAPTRSQIGSLDRTQLIVVIAGMRDSHDQLLLATEQLRRTAIDEANTVAKNTEQDYSRMISISIGVMLIAVMLSVITGFSQAIDITNHLRDLTVAATKVASGQFSGRMNVDSNDELGAVAAAFNQMTANLSAAQARIDAQQEVLTRRNTDLEQTLAELQHSVVAREELSATVRDLSVPVIRVRQGVLVMPLIGSIDDERVDLLIRTLLERVERDRARFVIMDVTGVPLIDTYVARALLETSDAVRLLGARVVLVGIRPELAQTLVSLGVDLRRMQTEADLASGLELIKM